VWMGQMLEQEDYLLANVAAGTVQADHVQSREVLGSLADHLGSIRVLTDEDGGVTERTSWGPWGERLEGGELSRVGYTGYQTERESGLRYSVHRYLDPRNGRWTRRDPLGDVDGQNRYWYVRNLPTGLTDPDGRLSFPLLRLLGALNWGVGLPVTAITGALAFYRVPASELLAPAPSPVTASDCLLIDKRIKDIDFLLAGALRSAVIPAGYSPSLATFPLPGVFGGIGSIGVFDYPGATREPPIIRYAQLQHELVHIYQINEISKRVGGSYTGTVDGFLRNRTNLEEQAYRYEKGLLEGLRP